MSKENSKNKNKCAYCGDSPVNHKMAYISQTLTLRISGLFEFVARASRNKFLNKVTKAINLFFVFFSQKMKVLYMGKNINDAVTGRSKVIWEEAKNRGIEMQQFVIYGRPLEQYRAKINGTWEYFESLPIPDYLPQSGYDYIDDKVRLKTVLEKNGVSVPKSVSVINVKEAAHAFNNMNKPVIVKPRIGSRGRHTTVFINTIDELISAFKIAQKLCKYVAVEEYLTGPVCRATVVDNKLVGFFVAYPPFVIGDGVHTVRELIDIKNKNKHERVDDIKINDESKDYLKRQNVDENTIIEQGKQINILSRTGRFFGGETSEIINTLHPKLKDYIETAARAIIAPVVGFDVIIEHPENDPDNQKWGIIEANSLPFIDLHYYPLHGEPVNVASYIWDLWK